MSTNFIACSILDKLKGILEREESNSKSKKVPIGVAIVAAQHKINLYLSSIGMEPFIMVDCDHNGKLTLTDWNVNESRTGSGKN